MCTAESKVTRKMVVKGTTTRKKAAHPKAAIKRKSVSKSIISTKKVKTDNICFDAVVPPKLERQIRSHQGPPVPFLVNSVQSVASIMTMRAPKHYSNDTHQFLERNLSNQTYIMFGRDFLLGYEMIHKAKALAQKARRSKPTRKKQRIHRHHRPPMITESSLCPRWTVSVSETKLRIGLFLS